MKTIRNIFLRAIVVYFIMVVLQYISQLILDINSPSIIIAVISIIIGWWVSSFIINRVN